MGGDTQIEEGIYINDPTSQKIETYMPSNSILSPDKPLKIENSGGKTFILRDSENSQVIDTLEEVDNGSWIVGDRIVKDSPLIWVNHDRNRVEDNIHSDIQLSIYHRMRSEIKKAYAYDSTMAQEKPQGDLLKENSEIIREELSKDSSSEADKYLKTLQRKGIEIRMTKYLTKDKNEIKVINLGKVDVSDVRFAARVIQVMHEYKDKLGLEIPKNLTITNFFDFENQTGMVWKGSKTPYNMGSCASEIFGTAGMAGVGILGRDIIIAPFGRTDENHKKPLVDMNFYYRVLRHELGHKMDIRVEHSTRSQREGFARMCDNKFSFETSKMNLREFAGYTNDVTSSRLLTILNEPADSEKFVKPEVYDVSGSFYCFLYEKLGAEKFMKFYGLLTGELVNIDGKIVENGSKKDKVSFESAKNNAVRAIRIATDEQQIDPNTLIGEYVNKINSK